MTVTTQCSRCGGFGLVHGYMGDPTDCSACGGVGDVWPPSCDVCGCFGRVGEPCKRCASRAQTESARVGVPAGDKEQA